MKIRWTRELVVYALDLHHRRHLRTPAKSEWITAGDDHPCVMTVRRLFGSWTGAIEAAGFRPRGPGGPRFGPRRRDEFGRLLPAAAPRHDHETRSYLSSNSET